MSMRRIVLLSAFSVACGGSEPPEDSATAPTTGTSSGESGSDDSGGSSDGSSQSGDGDGSTGDGDGSTGDGTTGDGDGSTGDGDGFTGDGDGSSGDGDGATGDGSTGDGDGSTGDGDGSSGDGDGDGTCLQCGITLSTNQSGSLQPVAPNTFLAEILQSGETVYALDEVGPGRVIYSGDSNILNEEVTDCPLYEWLGQTGTSPPVIGSIGSNTVCAGLGNSLGSYPTWSYIGQNVPAQYLGDPAALLADYDAIIYCPLRSMIDTVTMDAAEATTLVDFVTVQGGGLYLVSEYFGGGLNQQAIDDVNSIANALGAHFLSTNLDWGQADGEVQIGCFPTPQ
jgi:hypothetical protein